MRRIADLYFMMKLWKPAYNYYYIAKKDFQSDEAWPYYASAVECAALAMFMLSSTEPGEPGQICDIYCLRPLQKALMILNLLLRRTRK